MVNVNNSQASGSGIGKIRHFIGERKNDWYNGADSDEILSQGDVSNRYSSSVIASAGDVVPKVFGTNIVQGRVIWASDIYLDNNGKPTVDIAYALCEGVVDGVIRIYAGLQLIYSPDSLRGELSGSKYWKKLKLHSGSDDQGKDEVIKSHEGENDTPSYRGLSYVVFKGLKLFKFGNQAPDLYFIVGRAVDEVLADEYAFIDYNNLGKDVFGIAGIPDDDFVYVQENTGTIWKVELSTNTWNNIGNAGSFSTSRNSIAQINGKIYYNNRIGLFEYSGSGTVWNAIHSHGTATNFFCASNLNNTSLVYGWSDISTRKIGFYDGTILDINYGDLPSATTPVLYQSRSIGFLGLSETGIVHVGMFNTVTSAKIFRKSASVDFIELVPSYTNNLSGSDAAYNEELVLISNSSFTIKEQLYTELQENGTITTESIESNTTVYSSDLEYFTNKPHITKTKTGDSKLWRRDGVGNYTQLPTPVSESILYVVKRIGSKLYCGYNNGFFQVGDVL